MIKSFILLISVLIVCNYFPVKNETVVTNLRCEYLSNPLGVDVVKPRFSWYIESPKRGYTQSACRILVSSSPGMFKKRKNIIWDSGKIRSGNNANVEYDGPPLESGRKYYWTVIVWDQDDRQSRAAETAFFSTGFFSQDDWKAEWIGAADTLTEAPLLRKTFNLEKPVEKAFVYVTGAGYYELYLNGEKVGDHVLDPAMTDYTKRVLYSTFDVTQKIKKGSNAVGAMLGNGGFNAGKLENRYSRPGRMYIRRSPVFLMQMEILFRDGTTKKVVTDDSWKSSFGPVTFNNIFGGEDYDARLEKTGWCSAGYDESGWGPAKLVRNPGGILQSQLMPPMRVTATLKPVARTHPSEGVYLFDMGQNFAGWWRIRVQGDEGLKVRVRGSETLNDSLFSAPLRENDKLSTNFKYHSLVWTDYTLKGTNVEVYEPRFFYSGLRYVEVTTDRPEKLRMVEAEGRVVGTDFEQNGSFVTSDTLLNRIHRINIWAQKGNNHGYPTDCPHREKGAYTGD